MLVGPGRGSARFIRKTGQQYPMMGDAREITRLATACWDYSWLTRRDSRQGEYGKYQLGQRFEELRARGFNALRVDPCPHLIAHPPEGVNPERFEIQPEGRSLRRGAARPVVVKPREALAELLRAAREHNVKLWLASWFVPDTQARRSFVRRPRDFVRVWSETLDFIHEQGCADTVVAVDVCHEFPSTPAAHGPHRRIFGRNPMNPLPLTGGWSPRVLERVEEYLLEVPRGLRAAFPDYQFGLSTTLPLEHHLHQLDTTELDFLDLHCWLNDDLQFGLASAEALQLAPGRLAERIQSRIVALVYRGRREYWHRRLAERLEEFTEFCRLRRLTPAMTEGYLRFASERAGGLSAPRQLAEQMVLEAVRQGIGVLSPGLQAARPHSPLWDDPKWLSKQTHHILTGPGR
jgi:hypothetical protein